MNPLKTLIVTHVRAQGLDKGSACRELAKYTAGFSGAELANVVNEAALLAGRKEADVRAPVLDRKCIYSCLVVDLPVSEVWASSGCWRLWLGALPESLPAQRSRGFGVQTRRRVFAAGTLRAPSALCI